MNSYQHKGKIYICGDMNSRVGVNTDYIERVDLVKPRNVIDYIGNHHGDVFVNFLSDVNHGMLNGRFLDNEFTCISTSGKSVIDYICGPYEEMECITDFKIVSMSTISNVIAHTPDSSPDHSFLYCDIKFSVDLCSNSQEIQNNYKRKYNITSIPNDFFS